MKVKTERDASKGDGKEEKEGEKKEGEREKKIASRGRRALVSGKKRAELR